MSYTASPAATFAVTNFSDAEKADIRRFCGYPPYGGEGNTGFQGWRFYQVYGLMEFRLNNLAPAELQNIRYYLSLIYPLEAAISTASANLGTDQAAVWIHNKNEMTDRKALYDLHRRELCTLLGLPAGPNLNGKSFDVVI